MNKKLAGFDNEYTDLRDFILKITWRIWEERGVDRINDYYGATAPVKTPIGVSHSAKDVVDGTNAVLETFPDRQLFGEDIIGSNDELGVYYSSHRIFSTMTHKGHSAEFGPASNKHISIRALADCVCEKNQVVDEWLVRDRAGIALQVGLDLDVMAKEQREKQGTTVAASDLMSRWACGLHNTEGKDVDPQEAGDLVLRHAQSLQALAQGDFANFANSHDRAVTTYFPCHSFVGGDIAVKKAWQEYANALPASSFHINHAIEEQVENKYPRTAIRWSYLAKHADGYLGNGTNSDVAVLGITHAEWCENKIIREWHLWDVISLKEQLL